MDKRLFGIALFFVALIFFIFGNPGIITGKTIGETASLKMAWPTYFGIVLLIASFVISRPKKKIKEN